MINQRYKKIYAIILIIVVIISLIFILLFVIRFNSGNSMDGAHVVETDPEKYEVFNGIEISDLNNQLKVQYNEFYLPVLVADSNPQNHLSSLKLLIFDSKKMEVVQEIHLKEKFFELIQTVEKNKSGSGYMITLNTDGSGKMFTYYYDKFGFREINNDEKIGFLAFSRLDGDNLYDFYYTEGSKSTIVKFDVSEIVTKEIHRQVFDYDSGSLYFSGKFVILNLFRKSANTIFRWDKDNYSVSEIISNKKLDFAWGDYIVYTDKINANLRQLNTLNVYNLESKKIADLNSNSADTKLINGNIMYGDSGKDGMTIVTPDFEKKVLSTPSGFRMSFTTMLIQFPTYGITFDGKYFTQFSFSDWSIKNKNFLSDIKKNYSSSEYPLPMIYQYNRD